LAYLAHSISARPLVRLVRRTVGGARCLLAILLLVAGLGASATIPVACAEQPIAGPTQGRDTKDVLLSGWYPWDPYQFTRSRSGHSELTGLDIALVRAIAERAGYLVDFRPISWARHLEALREGALDLAAGATHDDHRSVYAYYSVPYRQETNVLYVPRASDGSRFGTVDDLLDSLRTTDFRLAVVEGFVYADPRINAFIADPANADRLVLGDDDVENLDALIQGEVDGVLADRLVAATAAWRMGWRELVKEAPLQVSTSIHLLFSKESVSPETVSAFNRAIGELKASGEYSRIVSAYMYPGLLAQAVDHGWFHTIEVLGVITFSLAGALLGYRGRYDIFGALLLGALPAVGGGVMRDLIAGKSPITLATSPDYLLLIVATVAWVYVLLKLLPHLVHAGQGGFVLRTPFADRVFRGLINVFDAAGLGAYTVAGVIVAVETNVQPLWLWGPLLATLSGAGGGILRDLVRQDPEMPNLKGNFYPEIALLWGLLLSVFLVWQTTVLNPEHIHLAIVVTLVGAFVTRMVVVIFRLRSPLYG